MPLIELTESTLPFAAGYLAGSLDRRLGTGTRCTMKVYMDIAAGKLSLEYLTKLEAEIARRWPDSQAPPSLRDLMS